MKRILGIVCLFLLFASVKTYAQEVRGVETKLTKYSGPEYKVNKWGATRNLWFGYSFTNMNSIPVSVDAELYIRNTKTQEHSLETTKSFTLKPGETYIWKFETMSSFCVYYPSWDRRDIEERSEPFFSYTSQGTDYYYIKYKAYKLL